ncbi:MAG: MTAP family purine nucleoside phosphorylase [Candidatus Thermoplasmatota archaeon]
MPGIGIIGGTGFAEWEEFEVEETEEKHTPWGSPSSPLYRGSLKGKKVVLVKRHGPDHEIPPHRINHRANIYALQEEVDEIIGICSAGALKADIEVPSISLPEDYVNFWNPVTFYNEKIKHVTPGLSSDLREELIEGADEADFGDIDEDGVYVQTIGPRLETKAEVKILSDFGDLVGMTMASEATLSKEASLEYACIVGIDNYANGVKDEEVEYDEIVDTAQDNWENIKEILENFLEKR